jgi:crossover junction endodeoxyribonuclease RusA
MRDTQEPIQEGEVVMIDLPFSPSVNNYWQRAKNGRLYIGKRGIEFRQKVISLIAKQDMRGKCGNALVDVALILHPPSRQIHDSDNYYKALFDALTKAKFWDDDSQVKLNVLLMGDIVSKGKIEMAVRLHCGAKIGAAELLSRV